MKILVYGHKGWIGGQVLGYIRAAGHEPVGAAVRADDEVAVAAEAQLLPAAAPSPQ